MHSIEIRRPRLEDVQELHKFFEIVLLDTYAKEGLSAMVDEIAEEIECKKAYLNKDLTSNGEMRYFLIALDKGMIVGTIEYGPAGHLIVDITKGKLKDVVEVGTVFVHPAYQNQGIGTLMLNMICMTLLSRNIEEFCLDSGYTRAQKFWKKKLGAPDYILKDYWCKGNDHMIWSCMIRSQPMIFKI